MERKRLKADNLEELELKAVLKHVYDLLLKTVTALDRYELYLSEIEMLLSSIAWKYGIDVDDLLWGDENDGERENR